MTITYKKAKDFLRIRTLVRRGIVRGRRGITLYIER